MKSRYTQAFDSLGSDEKTREERIKRIQSAYAAQSGGQSDGAKTDGGKEAKEAMPTRRRLGKRGIAVLSACAVVAVAVIPAAVIFSNSGLDSVVDRLADAYVDMEGVKAFGVWNAPSSPGESGTISNVVYVNAQDSADGDTLPALTAKPFSSQAYAVGSDPAEEVGEEQEDGVISGEWSDEDRYDWESDYDWDPEKANVLIAFNDDGTIDEVVYERTNGRGQVRQDSLGNAATVYVSKDFTYVMYVSDSEWQFWKNINYAQTAASSWVNFACHHDSEQTVVIHNATGKVFALKDLIPHVNAMSGATNYTMQATPFYDNVLCVEPMYGSNYNLKLWYRLRCEEGENKLYYDFVIPDEWLTDNNVNVRAVRQDIYGQQYLLVGDNFDSRVGAGLVQLGQYEVHKELNTLTTTDINSLMYGTDGRMYCVRDGVLMVFCDNFELAPVSADAQVKMEGVADTRTLNHRNGINYTLVNGYLFSMFGEVWKVGEDGSLATRPAIVGTFPNFADEGYLLGGEVIAMVNAERTENGYYPINGEIVQIDFSVYTEDNPVAAYTHIIDASQIDVSDTRFIVEQNSEPYSFDRGESRHYVLTVQDGKAYVDYIAYGYGGGIKGLTKPITEPLRFN